MDSHFSTLMKGGHDVLPNGRLTVPVKFSERGEANRLHALQRLGQRSVCFGDLSLTQSRA